MRNRNKTTLTILTLAMFAAAPRAQDAGKNTTPLPTITVNVEFAGGTLSELLAEIRKAGDDANILASANAKDIELPSVTLKNASVYAALKSIAQIVTDYHVQVGMEMSTRGEQPVYSMSARRIQQQNVSGASVGSGEPSAVVFSLSNLTNRPAYLPADASLTIAAETILTAIDTGLSVAQGKTKPTIRYHEDSGLLFVYGTPAHIDIASVTVRTLEQDMQQRRRDAQQKQSQDAQKAARRGTDRK